MSPASGHARGEPRRPPAWLKDRELPCVALDLAWFRCAPPSRPRLDWDNRPTSRFSGSDLPFRTLYLAEDTPTGFWECFGDDLLDRAPDTRSIPERTYRLRIVVQFGVPTGLRLLNVMDARTLRAIGADGATFKSAYTITQPWADAIMRHPRSPDGIIYESRLNNGRRCLALFEKPGIDAHITTEMLRNLADDAEIRFELIREKVAVLPP